MSFKLLDKFFNRYIESDKIEGAVEINRKFNKLILGKNGVTGMNSYYVESTDPQESEIYSSIFMGAQGNFLALDFGEEADTQGGIWIDSETVHLVKPVAAENTLFVGGISTFNEKVNMRDDCSIYGELEIKGSILLARDGWSNVYSSPDDESLADYVTRMSKEQGLNSDQARYVLPADTLTLSIAKEQYSSQGYGLLEIDCTNLATGATLTVSLNDHVGVYFSNTTGKTIVLQIYKVFVSRPTMVFNVATSVSQLLTNVTDHYDIPNPYYLEITRNGFLVG